MIRFRFSERIISKLMSIDFSLLSKEVADECLKELYQDITEDNIDEVVDAILEQCKPHFTDQISQEKYEKNKTRS